MFYATFREIQNVLSFNEVVDENDRAYCLVWRLLKANGENCQISYNKELKVWGVSSKNVSILVRNEKDIEEYVGERFAFAILIARCFLKMLANSKYT